MEMYEPYNFVMDDKLKNLMCCGNCIYYSDKICKYEACKKSVMSYNVCPSWEFDRIISRFRSQE